MELSGIIYFDAISVIFSDQYNADRNFRSSFIQCIEFDKIKKREKFPFFFDFNFQNQKRFFFESGLSEICPDQCFSDKLDIEKLERSKIRSLFGIHYCDQSKRATFFRDAFGLTPLFYHFVPNQFFAFSTCINKLIQVREVKNNMGIDLTRLNEYLTGEEDYHLYSNQTFYSGIRSCLPGHITTIDRREVGIKPYLLFELKDDFSSDIDSAKELKRLFSNSVNAAIGHEQRIGSHLSGGLDSSSISAISREIFPHLDLHTFYFNASSSFDEEKHYISDVVNKIHSKHHIVSPSENFLPSIYTHTYNCGYPSVLVIGPFHKHQINTVAKDIGIRVMLEGEGGDSCLGHGVSYLDLLLEKGDFEELENIFVKRSRLAPYAGFRGNWDQLTDKQKANETIYHFYFLRLIKGKKVTLLRRQHLLDKVYLRYGIGFLKYTIERLINAFYYRISERSVELPSLVTRDLGSSFEKNNIRVIEPGNFIEQNTFETNFAIKSFYNKRALSVYEEYYNISLNSGVISEFPFYNLDLFELNMSIPLSLKYNNGLTRGHMRAAMKGILPESTRLRYDKADFSDYGKAMAQTLLMESRELLEETTEVWQYINRKSFYKAVELLKENNYYLRKDIVTYVLRTVTLAVWLNYYKENKG